MTSNTNKTYTSSSGSRRDCYAFMNWQFKLYESIYGKVDVFRSLVATVKLQPTLDDTLEAKAVKFLKSVKPKDKESTDAFLSSFASNSDDYSIAITTATMKMLHSSIWNCSAKVRLALIKADLIPQLMTSLNPQSLSFTEAFDIHLNLSIILRESVQLATPDGLRQLKIHKEDEQQAVHETLFKQAVAPSENVRREWNEQGGELREMWKTMDRKLRMEGIEDAMDEKLQTDKNGNYGGFFVATSIDWNNLQGMNI
ncbi:hypothetical protein BLNAU_18553 [Blattamonas nauphoetae]|uniref:Uncharacterized protein n=1 Tax=Blattamonas nauphoetae TaxID=2049346 RepID=A0ABQ9X780_9EUKA|nr:hypothetical protein BLNAU_18553 [Blattamonas nauphoetae]